MVSIAFLVMFVLRLYLVDFQNFLNFCIWILYFSVAFAYMLSRIVLTSVYFAGW